METQYTKIVSSMDADRERILDYARKKFFAEGFNKISMDEIAVGLGMSKKTIYKNFEKKEVLVEEAVFSYLNANLSELTIIHSTGKNSVEKLCMSIQLIGSMLARISQRCFSDMQVHYPRIWQKVEEYRSLKIRANFGAIFTEGQLEGVFKPYPIDLVMQVLLSAIRGVINPEFLWDSSLANKDAFQMTTAIIIHGLLTEDGNKIFKKFKIGESLCKK